MSEEREAPPPEPSVEDFLGAEPTRELRDWWWLWGGDRPFPIRSHRPGLLGRLLVAFKRLLRPLVKVPQNDLWERQRTFNLILLEHLQRARDERHSQRLAELEGAFPEHLAQLLRHNDALFARLDWKLDRYRREAEDLASTLGAALAVAEDRGSGRPAAADGEGASGAARAGAGEDGEGKGPEPGGAAPREAVPRLVRAWDERAYLELERRFRGTEEEIGERLAPYLPTLQGRGPVLDLGCGRGEALALLTGHGIDARGVDTSAAMVARCRERGLEATEADLFEHLAATKEGTLGGVVSFHVIEHLPPEAVDRLVRLAFRALAPGGVLILETPNPLSLVVAARNFWLDPTHRRPIHPESLELSFRLAGFDPVERLDLRPFPAAQCLPQADLAAFPEEQRPLADALNRLRDRLDDLLHGHQDYAVVGEKAAGAGR